MICLILGYGARPLPVVERILAEEEVSGLALTDESCIKVLGELRSASVVFIYAHTLPEPVADAIRESRAKVISAGGLEELSNVPQDIVAKAKAYYILGGVENLRSLVRFLATLAGDRREYSEPREVPMHGIYHPQMGVYTSLSRYLEDYKMRPLVGVLFWRSAWLYGDLTPVKEVVEELERQGLGVIPVFTYGKDPVTGLGEDRSRAVDEFFTIGGRPVVEAIVSLISFGAVDLGDLSRVGVPVLAPLRSYSQPVSEWVESSKGVDYMTQVYGVIVPELAGAAEPLFIAGTKSIEGYKRGEAFREHVKHLARRVRKWVELRRKPRSQVKVAIVLINPPCKGLEASVAVGMGLDVPESVVRLLHKLKEEGYHLGDSLPESGEGLVKLILERKAISEFRWTSVEEVVERGGALGFVTLEEYLRWLSELPDDLREKIIEDWGKPEDVLSGRAPKELAGMVYEGKFVVPGVRFGNVVVMVQPKFGCAGSRCDGRVCRVLHDPTITPPHQWWAAYRWVTRKFKADLLIHFGTHGYLEFRPGKGVGLSPSCVPEATLDDAPHLYVYIVSNPMEGVIAKRRGYAVLVDHMYPPMAMAEALDELDSLLKQYAHAKSMGDEARRMMVYRQILEEAERSRVKVTNPIDEKQTIEEVHRYVDLVRGSQVNLGLHVFGHPPRDPRRLAEYIATVMAYDSHCCPSIRRALAEAFGLDYDEIRKNPMASTGGVSNRELLERLHEVAVRSLERLLEGVCHAEGS